jgi:hypothetical protein
MAIYDLAWERWTRAADVFAAADKELHGLQHLPDTRPHKLTVWTKVKAAYTELGSAKTVRVYRTRRRTSQP